ELDLALELQRAVHHRVGPDHDPRRTAGAEPDPAASRRLAHPDVAAHVRADAHGDVAGDGVHAAGHFRAHQADAAADRADVAVHAAAAIDVDAAAHRIHVVAGAQAGRGLDPAIDGGERFHLGLLAQPDRTVDGGQLATLDAAAGADAAVDGGGVAEHGAVADADAAVHRAQVADLAAGINLDAAVDAADVLGGQGRRGGEREAEEKGEGESATKHGMGPLLAGHASSMHPRSYNRTC